MRLRLLALVAIFFAFLVTPVSAFAATLSLSPASGQLNKGCTVTITIELDTAGAQTDGTDVILSYEPAKLSITQADITKGTIYGDYPGNSVDASTGKISLSGIASVSQAYTGKGNFTTLKFNVLETATGNTTLKFDFDPANKGKTTDSNVVERGTIQDVLTSVTDGSYTIGSGSCATGNGAPALPTLPVDNSSGSGAPTTLPEAGLLDNTVFVTSLGVLLVVMGIAGIALL